MKLKSMNRSRGRPKHSDILTPREWEVLGLIEEGLTNEAIAERLGINFGTAKYHVAEIIAKLGVSTREEAIDAARGRERRPATVPFWHFGWLSQRLGLPALGVAVVAVVALIVAVMTIDIVPRGTSAPASEEDLAHAAVDFAGGDEAALARVLTQSAVAPDSFYFEEFMTMTVQMKSQSTHLPPFRTEVWHEAPDRWRVHSYSPLDPDEPSTIMVADGQSLWLAYSEEGTYWVRPITDRVAEFHEIRRPSGISPFIGGRVGPMPGDSIQDSFENFGLVEAGLDEWNVAGREDLVGRESYRVEAVRSGNTPGTAEIRYWIDPHHLFLLRVELESEHSLKRIEMRALEYNIAIDPDVFTFEPAPGMTQVEPPDLDP